MLNSKIVHIVLSFLDQNFYKKQIKAHRILDLGAGQGWLSYWLRIMNNELIVTNYQSQIDAIEIQEKFKPALTKQFYTNVTISNILLEYKQFVDYDLICSFEVIEHLPKQECMQMLEFLIANNKYLIVSTPNGFREGGDEDVNQYQKHLCGFTKRDAKLLGLNYKILDNQLYMFSKKLQFPPVDLLAQLRHKFIPSRLRVFLRKLF